MIHKLIFLGPQGAGKGTQAQIIAEKLGVPAISMGQLLRDAAEKGTEAGLEGQKFSKQGQLVPDGITKQILSDRLAEPDMAQGYVLDGYPRNKFQLAEMKTIDEPTNVIVIDISDAEAVRRLGGRRSCPAGHVYHLEFNPPKKAGACDYDDQPLSQRVDDAPGPILERLKIYRDEATTIINYYESTGVLIRIDGQANIKEVTQRIVKKLGI